MAAGRFLTIAFAALLRWGEGGLLGRNQPGPASRTSGEDQRETIALHKSLTEEGLKRCFSIRSIIQTND